MSIKAGSVLHNMNGFVIDRIQSAGPGNLNIPEEKIYELGNWQTVATVRDIPDLSFDLESYDTSAEIECILTGKDPESFTSTATNNANRIDFQDHIPIDVISPFKSRRNAYDIVKGLAVPYLTLERATYRFGLRQNATQQFTLRGDSIFYTPGQPYYEEFVYNTSNSGVNNYDFTNGPAIVYAEGSNDLYALCIVAVSDNGSYRRLFAPEDYTERDTTAEDGFKITATGASRIEALGGTVTLRVIYASDETFVDYNPEEDNTGLSPNGTQVHQNVSVKPAAVRPKDIDVYIGSTDATPFYTRLNSVQSVEATWSVTLENDEEFGNKHYVAQDYDTPDVTGTIGVKPFDPADLWGKLSQITGVPETEVIGPELAVPVPLAIQIRHPDTGSTMKTLVVPDARFQIPGLQGRVQTKLETQFSFTSDAGLLYVHNGDWEELV